MPDSVAAVQKIDQFRALAQKWADENMIDINGQQLFPNIRIEVGLDFSVPLKPIIEVYDNTSYREEWRTIRSVMPKGMPRFVLLKFIGKENVPVPIESAGDMLNPSDMAHRITHELQLISRLSRTKFNWQMKCDNRMFHLITDPIR